MGRELVLVRHAEPPHHDPADDAQHHAGQVTEHGRHHRVAVDLDEGAAPLTVTFLAALGHFDEGDVEGDVGDLVEDCWFSDVHLYVAVCLLDARVRHEHQGLFVEEVVEAVSAPAQR